jgi:hypothetical protein
MGQGRGPQTARFQVVSGRSYEGAIIPASHDLDWFREPGVTTFWTPTPGDVEVAEELLLAYLTGAAEDPSKVSPPLITVGTMSPPSSLEELRALLGSLARYKRQYVGRMYGSHRRILVNGLFETIARDWRERLFNVMDGGCGYWHFDADLPQRRVVRFWCEPSA